MYSHMASLCLNPSEALLLVDWFKFQEENNIDVGNRTSISEEDIRLMRLLLAIIYKVRTEPQRYSSVRLNVQHCKTAFNWYSNLPELLIDDRDINLHTSIGDFLMKYDGDYEEDE